MDDAKTAQVVQLLTVEDVADALQCGRSYVYRLLQTGQIRALKIGRLTRISPMALGDFVDQRAVQGDYDRCERWAAGGGRARETEAR